jgi:hypothetical protein
MPDNEQEQSVPTPDVDVPDRARQRKQSRDRKTGLVRPRKCQLYLAGHTVHYIQAIHSAGEVHREGSLVASNGNVITVDFGDELKRYRNHDVEPLVEIVGIGGSVRICESYVILRFPRGGGNACFSIANVDEPWIPCDHTPLKSISPEALADRLNSHGGFSVPGSQLIRATNQY